MAFLDVRQGKFRGILQQLFPYVAGQTLDILLESINSDLTSPLKVDAMSTPGLTVNVGSAIVSNPESNRNRSISPINSLLPIFTSGTITFPSSNGGNITTSTGGSYTLTLPSNEYAQALLELDSTGHLIVNMGTPNATEADATIPIPDVNTFPFAYITLFNNGGTVQNIAQDVIFQFMGGGGSSTGTPVATGYDAVVGSSADVSSGLAQYTSLQTALNTLGSNSSILVLKDYSTVENINIPGNYFRIDGSGADTTITGNITTNTSISFSKITNLYVTGNVTTNTGTTSNEIRVWVSSTSVVTDNGTSDNNLIVAIQS